MLICSGPQLAGECARKHAHCQCSAVVTVPFSELGELGRGAELQARYDKWMTGLKEQYGTTGE